MEGENVLNVQALIRQLGTLRDDTARDLDSEPTDPSVVDTRRKLLAVHTKASQLAGDVSRY